jgi:HEAT repeat-containing protein 5
MGNHDADILTAINDQDPTTGERTVTDKTDSAPFFHVIFGLIFEALTASVDMTLPTPDRQTTTIAALQALRYLVQPEYSGHVPMDPAVFGEFLDLCYRLAMTGTIQTQVYLVEMLGSLAACRRSWLDNDSGYVPTVNI